MKSAPLDGTRVILRHIVYYFVHWPWSRHTRHLGASLSDGDWVANGDKWEEARWVPREKQYLEKDYRGGDWKPWCGNSKTWSTESVHMKDCLGWIPLPTEDSSTLVVSQQAYDHMKAELERPPRKSKRLTKLMKTEAPWDKN